MRLRSDMEIKMAIMEDVADIARLEALCFSVPWSEAAIAETMEREEVLFLCAQENGNIAGYVGSYYCVPEGYITNIAVDPAFRRKGIGKALVETLLREGRKLGLSSFTLEVRKSNLAAIALYESLGFKDVGLRPRFYSAPEEDARLMTYYFDASEE